MDKSLLDDLEEKRRKGRETGKVNKKDSASQVATKLSARDRLTVLLFPARADGRSPHSRRATELFS